MKYVVFTALLLCTGCAQTLGPAGPAKHELAASSVPGDGNLRRSIEERRLMVYSASLDLEVGSISTLGDQTKTVVERAGGFIAESSGGDSTFRAEIRVSPEKLQPVLEELAALGDVQAKSIQAEDVTDSVQDLDARLKNLSALRDRYRGLLEKTHDVKDLLAVEQELNRVEGEIERLTGQRAGITKRVSYSRIQLTAKVRTIYGPVGYVIHGACWVVEKLFVIR